MNISELTGGQLSPLSTQYAYEKILQYIFIL